LKELRVLSKGYFYVPKINKNNEDDFVDARVDERCLWLAWQY
jgi:hypothetical protein